MKLLAAVTIVASLQIASLRTACADTAVAIADNALSSVRGVISVNEIAGNGNRQSSLVLIGGNASVRESRESRLRSDDSLAGDASTAKHSVSLGAGAFALANGIVTVNLASGDGNAESNAVFLGTAAPTTVVSDATLGALTSHRNTSADPSNGGSRDVSIAPGAFSGARGIVQVNAVAGSNNSVGNSLTLRIAPSN